jgi:hypothetical protein
MSLKKLGAFILASCAKTLQTTTWTGAATASYDEEIPEDSCGIDIEAGTMRVEKTVFGGEVFAFVRVPLGIEFFANEITEAKLFLYAAQSEPPKELLIGTVNGRWTLYTPTFTEAKALVNSNGLKAAALQPEDEGWVSVSVTEIVKAWVRTDIQNFGFALFPIAGETQGVFADMYDSDENAPYLKVSGRVGRHPAGYGKFGFTRVPEDGRLDDTVNGNCLSYAVRDSVPVYLEDLGWSYSEIIPATGPGVSPEKHYWEMAKYGYLYRSKLLYYAVTKDTDEITVHRPSRFADVELYDYVNSGVEYVFKNGFMTGISDAPMLFKRGTFAVSTARLRFSPDTALTRGMTADAFYRVAGSPDADKFANTFDDMDTGNRYYDAVKWATANGIIFDNSGSGKFASDRKITREEAAAAFYNYQLLSGFIPPDVLLDMEPEDVNEISKWAKEAAKKLLRQMIFRCPGGMFIPKGEITRIEFAGMLRDYCEYSKN